MPEAEGLVEKARAALQVLREGLAVDGYSLELQEVRGRLVLSITAGAGACRECLIPKEALAGLATDMLREAGVLSSGSSVDTNYPGEENSDLKV
jgi:hypothetical protein